MRMMPLLLAALVSAPPTAAMANPDLAAPALGAALPAMPDAAPARATIALEIRMTMQRACAIAATADDSPVIHCTSATPYRALINAEAEPSLDAARMTTLRSLATGTVPIARQRLTVEY